jgi:Fungal specific transcription factor domain
LSSINGTNVADIKFVQLGVRTVFDAHSLWVLTGTSVRIAQRLGLHRDGSKHDISPFDVEMRRRTWWQIVFLDGHSSKLAGAGFPAWLAKFDTKIPKNISDSDLSPTMKEPPQDKEGATEMIFCCLRYETAQALRTARTTTNMDGSWGIASGASPELLAEKDKAIDALEIKFEKQFVQHCDPSIPLHLLVIYVAKSVICTMRIMAHHPRQYPDKGATMSQIEKDMLFTESLKEMEYDSLGYTSKAIRGYLWHITSHFQLDAFIYLLSELRYRTTGDLVERAWQQIKFSFENRPEMITDTKNSLYFAIGNLALKAWAMREEAMGSYQAPPRFISLLRSQRNIPDPPRPLAEIQNKDPYSTPRIMDYANEPPPPAPLPQNTNVTNIEQQWGNWNPEVDINMPEITPVDWAYWQTLMDGDLPAWDGDIGGDFTGGQKW